MMKRLISLLLAVMLLCSLCSSALAQARTDGAEFYNRTADASTLDSWKTLFGPEVNSTANVGTVWTDKTVTKTAPSDEYGKYDKFEMKDEDTNFMVTLSTISATMSITGHETLPTDTVFVLDLSSSMYRVNGNNNNTIYVLPMVNAVNKAIHTLLNLNTLNRVGVVVYYGHDYVDMQSNASHYKTLLPLNSYNPINTTAEYPPYLIMDDNSAKFTGIRVNTDQVTRRDNQSYISDTYTVPGVAGTYTQLGIKKALDMMLDSTPTIPESSEFQAGATRIPIMVLMSDGEPTAADHEFAKIDTATMGNNSTIERSPAESDFLTQLTAAMARELMDMHYEETTPLFYTLGLGSSISYDVMDPRSNDAEHTGASSQGYTVKTGRDYGYYQNTDAQVNAKIQEYWEDIVPANGQVSMTYLYGTSSPHFYESSTAVTVNKVSSYTTSNGKTFNFDNKFPWSLDQKYYVDKFFYAENEEGLGVAFNDLVQEIILQSAYYPTYVENGAIGMSGYVDFHDEIGDMMEVKAIHGLARRGTNGSTYYYKGEQIAQYVQTCITGNGANLANVKTLMTELIQKRLEIPESAAEQIINTIIEKNGTSTPIIYWKSDADYSNAFSWYATADEDFIALDVGQTKPDNAAYRITTYWYADPNNLETTNSFIRVKHSLSGMQKQCVTWSVPASMIPLVKYAVTIENDRLTNPGDITVQYTSNNPMRAMYEVGLRSDVTKYNAVQILQELGYKADQDGKYTFFSNKWDTSKSTNPDIQNIDGVNNTVAYFRPAEQNERYFITTDSPLYTQDGNTIYTGSSDPSGKSGYYIKAHEFRKNGDTWEIHWILQELPANFTATQIAGKWYVDIYTPRNPNKTEIAKQTNATNSLAYSTIEKLDKILEDGKDVTYSISILGNNGTFHFTADTGIAITKAVDNATAEDENKEFTFIVAPADGQALSGTYNVDYVAADGTATQTTVEAKNNAITLKLKHGEMAYLAGSILTKTNGLPAGDYTITEQIVGADGEYFYEVSRLTVDGTPVAAGNSTTVSVRQFHVTDVRYTNVPVTTGSICITKEVTTADGIIAPNATFTFEVQLSNAYHGGKTVTLTRSTTTAAETVSVAADGKFTVTLKAGEAVTISGLAADENATVTVKETSIPQGFSVTSDAEMTKAVVSNKTVAFPFTNQYTAEPASVTLSGTKALEGRTLAEDEFSFELRDADGQTLATATNAVDGTFSFTALTYTKPGIYTYTVKEVVPTEHPLPGVTYDTTVCTVAVTVADNGEGKLVASTAITKADGTATNALAFTNIYTPAPVNVSLSGTKTLTGREMTANDVFTFALYSSDGNVLETVSNAADGTFSFAALTYTKPGTYAYTLKEVAGTLPGVTYDTTEYYIQVDVTDVDAVLTTAISGIPDGGLVFTNTYDATDTSLVLSGLKTLVGRELRPGEFSFELRDADGQTLATATNAVDGTFSFPALTYTEPGTYTYTVKEVAGTLPGVTYDETEYHIQVDVTDVDAVLTTAISGIPDGGLVFTNTYDAMDTSLVLSGLKTLVGRELLPGEFSFSLYTADADFIPQGEPLQSVRNNADGTFVFPSPLDFDAIGEYYFVVKEDVGSLPGVTYDQTEYHITLVVTDENAVLTPKATVAQVKPVTTFAALPAGPLTLTLDDLLFTNFYDAEDTSVTFSGTKALTGRNLVEGEFSFTLYEADAAYTPGKALQTARNAADGAFAFTPIPYDTVGTYYYVVREEQGSLADMTYDATEYRIQVVVTDTAEAKLSATVTVTTKNPLPQSTEAPTANTLAFHNAHDETDAVVVFSGVKTYAGHSLAHGDFTFTLYSADDSFNPVAPLQTATNAADGAFAFQPVVFSQVGAYYFVVREDQGGKSYVTYDGAEYRIFVEVWNNNGVLVANVTANQVANGEFTPVDPLGGLTFTNHYIPASVTVPFSGLKVYQGAALQSGMFTFHLYAADADFIPVGAPLDSAVNAIDGSFAFSRRAFHSAGVYRFLVMEDASTPLPSVSYDPTVYQVTITVTDNGHGSLVASTSITTSEGLAADMPVFENVYHEVPETGDHSSLEALLALCLLSLTALLTLVIFSRRKART